VKQWVPKELPPLDTNFIVNNMTYHIAPSSLHGLGLFSMDGITVKYNTVTELMDYVGPCYDYSDWMWLVPVHAKYAEICTPANYIQLINNDKNKGETIYIDGRPKAFDNITGFINTHNLGQQTSNQIAFMRDMKGIRYSCAQ
jgi:hypothetical protein